MSTNNGVWHDAELDPPGAADVWQHVLIVKATVAKNATTTMTQ